MARTAVVAGTASAVVNSSQQKQAAQANAAQAPPVQAPAAPPAAPAAGPSMLDQLKELAALKDAGVLSDDEFAAAKAKLLG